MVYPPNSTSSPEQIRAFLEAQMAMGVDLGVLVWTMLLRERTDRALQSAAKKGGRMVSKGEGH